MADRLKQKKEPTPPPLLLMPASEGLTFTGNQATNVLLPVPQGEASLITSEDVGEADSFLGQSPPKGLSNPPSHPQAPLQNLGSYSAFQPQVPQPDLRSDFLSQAPAPPHIPQAPPSSVAPFGQVPAVPTAAPNMMGGGPPMMSVAPPQMTNTEGQSQSVPNYHRVAGRPRYAQPPPGTYADSAPVLPASYPAPPPASYPASQPFVPDPSNLSGGVAPPPVATSISMGGPAQFDTSLPPPSSMDIPPLPTFGSGPPAPPTVSSSAPVMGVHGLYLPVQFHWFYGVHVALQQSWIPFSIADSLKLEEAHKSGVSLVSTDGGRFDVDLTQRTHTAVYWDEAVHPVRRASWFYRPEGDSQFAPYDEDFAEQLEEIYETTLGNGEWHRRHEFPNGDVIVMHSPNVFVSFRAAAQPDEWGNTQGDMRPRVVKRGVEEFEEIPDGEPSKIDHVVFVIHGVGQTCDLRFRNIIECVDDFRKLSIQMTKSHFGRYQDEGRVGRVEFLPVRWHAALHGDATGIDRRLKAITLHSIAKLRQFTNDTLLDILFYASPTYAQQIADTVGNEMNRMYKLFLSRNPDFQGGTSVVGHSLGSLILFDLLVHQRDPNFPTPENLNGSSITPQKASSEDSTSQLSRDSTPCKELNGDSFQSSALPTDQDDEVPTIEDMLARLNLTEYSELFQKEQIDLETLSLCEESDIKEMGIPLGPRKKIQGFLKQQKQKQSQPKPEDRQILMPTPQDQQQIQQHQQQQLPHTSQILSPTNNDDAMSSSHDPLLRSASSTSVSYMMGVAGTGVPFVRYPQLCFQPANFFALGSPIAMFITVRGLESLGDEFHFPTCPGFFNIFHPFDPVAYRIEPLLTPSYPPKASLIPHHKGRKRLHLELRESLTRMGTDLKQKMMSYLKSTWQSLNDFAMAHRKAPQQMLEEEVNQVMSQMTQAEQDAMETESIVSSQVDEDVYVGSLNQGRRVDFVLQEKPIESFNDYLFAVGSHISYWESEDTSLLILKEVYSQMGIAPIRPGLESVSPGGPLLPSALGQRPSPPKSVPLYQNQGGVMTHASQMVSPPGMPFARPPVGGYMNQPMGGLPGSQPPNVGPPPRAGFVRKS